MQSNYQEVINLSFIYSSKVDKLTDIITGNPITLEMVIYYVRYAVSQC